VVDVKLLNFNEGRARLKSLEQREKDVEGLHKEIHEAAKKVSKWIIDIRAGSNISHANVRKLYWYLQADNFDIRRARKMLRQIADNQPWPSAVNIDGSPKEDS
jgi:hypothetical protein